MTINERIREIREKNNWSRREFAEIVGMSRQEIYLIDYGATNPTITTLRKIADALDIDLTDLIRKEEDK